MIRKFYKRKSKYGNIETLKDGIKFDSRREANRYCVLLLMLKSGVITDLELQVPFVLYPNIYFDTTLKKCTLEKKSGKSGFCLQRGSKYYADFVYFRNGKQIVEDAKGARTTVYRKKANQMLKLYGIKILET